MGVVLGGPGGSSTLSAKPEEKNALAPGLQSDYSELCVRSTVLPWLEPNLQVQNENCFEFKTMPQNNQPTKG